MCLSFDCSCSDFSQEQLKSWVKGNLTECARSIFIFDEMEKMPPGLIDVLEPFLGPSHVVFRTNYRKAIYVFIRYDEKPRSRSRCGPVHLLTCMFLCSTSGEDVINKLAVEHRQAGRDREEIRLSDLQDSIAQMVYSTNTSKSSQSTSPPGPFLSSRCVEQVRAPPRLNRVRT